ncbi:MAG: tetratricopeptide repeat protein [Planctomycetes bacterium]|nr:tetratricopeptide repeat protein [Planctomycetota bacterium]
MNARYALVRMLRLVGYFALVFGALYVLRSIPVVGDLFRIPFLGFIVAAALVSAALSWFGVRAVDRRRTKAMLSRIGAVETPHNQGKLGSFLLAQGRARAALPHLERAVQGEGESAEWNYRLGMAYLQAKRAREAIGVLETAARIDEGHAYGSVLLRLSEAHLAAGSAESALETLARFERNHGPSPESALRRGLALKQLGDRPAARRAFAEVSQLASRAAKFQKSGQRGFVLRAFFMRVLP